MSDELRAHATALAGLDLGLFQTGKGDDGLIRSGIVLARAWLAKHPADDAEPAPVCPECNGTKRASFHGRPYTCGACATHQVSVAFKKALESALAETEP